MEIIFSKRSRGLVDSPNNKSLKLTREAPRALRDWLRWRAA